MYGVAAIVGATLPLLLLVLPKHDPTWLLLLAVAGVALVYGLIHVPQVFPILVLAASQFKNLAALQPIQGSVDLTLIAMILLSVAIAKQLLVSLSSPAEDSLDYVFGGQGKAFGAFLLFGAIVASSYLYTLSPNYGWTKLSRFMGIGGAFFLSAFVLVKNDREFRRLVIAFLAFGMLQATRLIADVQFREASDVTDVTKISAGWIMGMCILLLVYYRTFEARFRQLALILVGLPLAAIGLVVSASRGAVVALVFAVLVTALRFRHGRSLLRAGLICLLIAASGFVAFQYFREKGGGKYEEKVEELVQSVLHHSASGTAGQRLHYYRAAIREVAEKPQGLGVGGWSTFYSGRDDRIYPHNLFLEVAVEEGLIGLSALLLFLGMALAAIRRTLDRGGERFVVVLSLVVYAITASLFSGDLDDHRMLWLWCGMAFSCSRFVYAPWPLIEVAGVRGTDILGASRRAQLASTVRYNYE